MLGFTIVGALVVVLCLVVLHQRPSPTQPPPARQPARPTALRARAASALQTLHVVPDPLDIRHLERRIFDEIFGTGFKTLRASTLQLGNTVVVHLSPGAFQALAPVELAIREELADMLQERAAAEGWTVVGALHLTLRSDPALVNDQLRVRTFVDEDTPVRRQAGAAPVVAVREGEPAPLVRLAIVGRQERDPATSAIFRLPADGSPATIGRSSLCDWPIKGELSTMVSRSHATARIEQVPNGTERLWGVRVTDNGSTHRTFVGAEPVAGATLTHGETFRLGPDLLIRVVVGTSVDADTPVQEA